MFVIIAIIICCLSIILNSVIAEFIGFIISLSAILFLQYCKKKKIKEPISVIEQGGYDKVTNTYIVFFAIALLSIALTYNGIFNHLFEIAIISMIIYNKWKDSR